MDIRDALNWRDQFLDDENFRSLLEETSKSLMAMLGDPVIEDGVELYGFKAGLLSDLFQDSLNYEMYVKPTIRFNDLEGLPDPADVEEDESEEDACIVTDFVREVSKEFTMDYDMIYRLVSLLYYRWDRKKIREDKNRKKEDVVKEIVDFIKTIK